MARRLPSLNALRSFEAAARQESMTRAAAALGVTHGAVSRQVRGLEAALGVPLLENRRGRLRLTASGGRLLAVLTDAFDRIADGVEAISRRDTGAVTVSCLGTFAMFWLIPRLHRFEVAHPGSIVRLTTSDADLDPARGDFDVAVRVGKPTDPASGERIALFDEWAGPVMAPALARRLGAQGPSAFDRMPLLHAATRPDAWADWFAAHGTTAADAHAGQTFEHAYFMIEAARAGLGAAIGFWHLVADDVSAGRLVAPAGFAPTGLRYVAVRPPAAGAPARHFAHWLRDAAAAFMLQVPPPAAVRPASSPNGASRPARTPPPAPHRSMSRSRGRRRK
jgi:LysR family glycine cleavage system transcriptional activator